MFKKSSEALLKHFSSYKLNHAANVILNLAINTNLYLNEKQPWILIKDKKNITLVSSIIYNVLESTRIIGLLLFDNFDLSALIKYSALLLLYKFIVVFLSLNVFFSLLYSELGLFIVNNFSPSLENIFRLRLSILWTINFSLVSVVLHPAINIEIMNKSLYILFIF